MTTNPSAKVVFSNGRSSKTNRARAAPGDTRPGGTSRRSLLLFSNEYPYKVRANEFRTKGKNDGFYAAPLALEPGKTEVTLFGDGSFQDLISVGSWAFYAPDFGLANAGIEPGQTVEHFESIALLAGLEAILGIDRTRRPIHIFTDCDAAIELIRSAAGHKSLATGSLMQRVRHLFERASLLTARRHVSLTRIASGSTAENKHCHRLASLKLRSGMAADPALSSQLAMHLQKQRLTTIKKEQAALRRKLAALEKEALTIEAQ